MRFPTNCSFGVLQVLKISASHVYVSGNACTAVANAQHAFAQTHSLLFGLTFTKCICRLKVPIHERTKPQSECLLVCTYRVGGGGSRSNATEDLNHSEENINDSAFFFFSENSNTGPY